MGRIEKTVFISYRRANMPWAMLIFQNLTAKGYDVFFDYKSINSGDFEQIILGNIRARAHFLVLLTPSALERCNEPGDWLRREFEVALDEKRNVVPLFLEGFKFGDASAARYLTSKLGILKKYNGLEVPASYFDEAMERLQNRFLNITLEAVLHPVSSEVQKEVQKQQSAAREEVRNKEKELAAQKSYKHTGSHILLEGQIVHFEAMGRGRPIIFLHSWVGSWRYWIASMQVASSSFRTYALDLWGFGESAHNVMRYTIDQQADLLVRFLDEMGIGKIALVGHGLGALVGFNFCSRWPRSVDRMMAINCPLYYDSINTRLRTSTLPDLISWLGSKSLEAAIALADATKADHQAITDSISSFQSNGLFSKMRDTQIPCLLVYGQNDPAIPSPPPDNSFNLPHKMHHIVLDSSGHFLMLDESARFNLLLMKFLALDSGVSPRSIKV